VDIQTAFVTLQQNVNADPGQVDEARRRRRMFERAFASRGLGSQPIGSLARGSQIEPINDVDLMLIHEAADHPDWGNPGSSAEDALEESRELIRELLGSPEALKELFGEEATGMQWVRHTRLQNHAVKCFLDPPEDEDAFTVDVVPALPRTPRGFWIPERDSRCWIETDPVLLIELVLERHGGYGEGQFVQLIRVLKRWSRGHEAVLKGLTIEVLALDHLRDEPRPHALAGFFTAAAAHIFEPIIDPAELCGEVQPDLDRAAGHRLLAEASELAAAAIAAAAAGEIRRAICIWREIFGGDLFPEPEGGCSDNGSAATAAAGLGGLVISPPARRQRPIKDSPGG
jgi:hypothetical protein